MELRYYLETGSLCIHLSAKTATDTYEVAPGIVLDFDAERRLVGIDIDRASQLVDLSRLEAEGLPVSNLSLTGSWQPTPAIPPEFGRLATAQDGRRVHGFLQTYLVRSTLTRVTPTS